eukprot:GHVR01120518.1.p1 GENE.GHVR01120518.1~~GHVR01120518.1.p1  ORF type:complete len:172 (-),score=40.05 GHVR01120518.1:594-1109(-)
MGCGASKLKMPEVPKVPELPKVPDVTSVSLNPQVLTVQGLTTSLLALPQWKKMAENGFDKADRDNSGYVEGKELEVTMQAIQEGVLGDLFPDAATTEVDKEAVQEAMKKYNKDNDSKLNKEEFVEFATEYIRITIMKNTRKYAEEKKDLGHTIERITLRNEKLAQIDIDSL